MLGMNYIPWLKTYNLILKLRQNISYVKFEEGGHA